MWAIKHEEIKMANENAVLNDNADSLDFDELETKLQEEVDLDSQLSELEFLKEEREKIGNPDNLGNIVKNVVWEQFLNQIAVTAGEDFIKDNRGLTLDLRDKAHIQTTENFEKGETATHNGKIDYQKRYDDWQDNFKKNEDGTIKTNKDNPNYKGNKPDQKVLNNETIEARAPFDANREKGSASTNKDHAISAAEMMRDSESNTHLEHNYREERRQIKEIKNLKGNDKETQQIRTQKKEKLDETLAKNEIVTFANSKKNLKDLDADANRSKRDLPMGEWLDSEREGKKPAERFNIDEEELRERDRIAREEYEKLKEEGKRKSIETGKQSQKEEAFRIGGKALRAMLMQLLAELVKEVIGKLVLWFKSAKRNLDSLLDSIKLAISTFISKLKTHMVNAGNTLVTTIATAIYGQIVNRIKKVWTMLKQGWKSLKEAIDYIKKPSNKNKPFGILILEVGKIVIAGLSAVGVIALEQTIETSLMTIPILAIPIPLLGSLASLLGLFLSGLVMGIIGAIALNLIDKAIANQLKRETVKKEIEKGNDVLKAQIAVTILNEKKLEDTKTKAVNSIKERHEAAAQITKDAMDNISSKDTKNEIVVSENKVELDNMLSALDKLPK
jgi:hypothetical protein